MNGHKFLIELDRADELELGLYAERHKMSLSMAAQTLMVITLDEMRERRATECWDGVIKALDPEK